MICSRPAQKPALRRHKPEKVNRLRPWSGRATSRVARWRKGGRSTDVPGIRQNRPEDGQYRSCKTCRFPLDIAGAMTYDHPCYETAKYPHCRRRFVGGDDRHRGLLCSQAKRQHGQGNPRRSNRAGCPCPAQSRRGHLVPLLGRFRGLGSAPITSPSPTGAPIPRSDRPSAFPPSAPRSASVGRSGCFDSAGPLRDRLTPGPSLVPIPFSEIVSLARNSPVLGGQRSRISLHAPTLRRSTY